MTGMSPEAAEAAARLLMQARGGHRTIPALPGELRPATPADGYTVQDTFAALWERPVTGFKIGCTVEAQRQLLRVDEPFTGRVFDTVLLEAPAELPASAFFMRGIECEFAFRMGASLPPREAPYALEDVTAAIDTFHPAIEVVDSRFGDWLSPEVGGPSIIADNGVNGALVLGTAVPGWRDVDLAAAGVSCVIDGETRESGYGGQALDGPLMAMLWVANHLSARGIGLAAGQAVTTGTCAGIHFVGAGQTAVADFGDLGQVQVTFSD